ncbi:MAG TPA: AbrB/MazE/SpoVT family DNA-binding domain-containing protein [Thermoanaerobaculia bacterium]|jgi:AbrB family looped-hinge helix DNA binding protein
MSRAVVSKRFQVVIPREIRRAIGLNSGQVLQIISKSGVITMVPDQAICRMRGYLKGMKTTALREKKSRGHPRRGGSR